jgi:hypothetical protein
LYVVIVLFCAAIAARRYDVSIFCPRPLFCRSQIAARIA